MSVVSLGLNVASAQAETTECMEIVSLPAIITVQGVYCFKSNLVTSITTGNAIEIQTHNVTIDMNGFKLGGASAGLGTQAGGINASNRKNIIIKNGNIRGFYRGIYLQGLSGSGHVIEQVRADGNTFRGFQVEGENNIIRNNHVINTGATTVGSSSAGIYVNSARNVLIADNVISGVSETSKAYGIDIFTSTRVEVRGNSIFELNAITKHGINFHSVTGLTIRENQIDNTITGITGTTGINEGFISTNIACLDNVTINFTTETSGCDLLDGHRSL